VELESLLQEQNETLKKAQGSSPPRRPSMQSIDHNFQLPPIQTSAPYVYKSTCNNPYFRNSPPSEKSHNIQRPASALDNLAEAAASSPPAAERASHSPDRMETEPHSGNSTMSFPSFPHNIFNTSPQKDSTRRPSIRTTPLGSPSTSSGLEMDNLPPKEILQIM
jgi:hypothetical protein